MRSRYSLEGRSAIVTGGRRGIGKGIALALADAGANVAIVSMTNDDRLAAVAEEVKSLGRRSIAVPADVSSRTDVENMASLVMNEFGRIDILINNAGMLAPGQSLVECNEANWNRVIDVNLKGVYLCCQAVGKKMIEQKSGSIINVSSRGGIYPRPRVGAYAAAKAGVVALTRQLSYELASYNIRVNGIAPGWVETDMSMHMLSTPENSKLISGNVVLGRIGKPEEIAALAVFLASDASSFITGQTILADGGGDTPPIVLKPG